ncbi:GNAT family N-acetyltransferase [Devosia sp. LjRoot3]|uniref:GNAT family N-acetyltransferase n=1 Tax=Devosia sp. LjRoot3 TaxID=3342319 RepID=UPI003ECD199F
MSPVIETERLLLRRHQVSDFEASCWLWGNDEVTRYIGGRPSTPEEVWSRLLRYAGHWDLLGYGYFAVVEKQSGAMIGEFGLADFHRSIDPPLMDPEAGWVLHPDHHGKGFAAEALTALLIWADAQNMRRTCCLIDPENTPSLRLAQRLGYVEGKTVSYHDKPSILLVRG